MFGPVKIFFVGLIFKVFEAVVECSTMRALALTNSLHGNPNEEDNLILRALVVRHLLRCAAVSIPEYLHPHLNRMKFYVTLWCKGGKVNISFYMETSNHNSGFVKSFILTKLKKN